MTRFATLQRAVAAAFAACLVSTLFLGAAVGPAAAGASSVASIETVSVQAQA